MPFRVWLLFGDPLDIDMFDSRWNALICLALLVQLLKVSLHFGYLHEYSLAWSLAIFNELILINS